MHVSATSSEETGPDDVAGLKVQDFARAHGVEQADKAIRDGVQQAAIDQPVAADAASRAFHGLPKLRAIAAAGCAASEPPVIGLSPSRWLPLKIRTNRCKTAEKPSRAGVIALMTQP
jgi:hypothetical protein